MPVQKVKGGYRYGKTGKVYKSREKAVKQGQAIEISKRKKLHNSVGSCSHLPTVNQFKLVKK